MRKWNEGDVEVTETTGRDEWGGTLKRVLEFGLGALIPLAGILLIVGGGIYLVVTRVTDALVLTIIGTFVVFVVVGGAALLGWWFTSSQNKLVRPMAEMISRGSEQTNTALVQLYQQQQAQGDKTNEMMMLLIQAIVNRESTGSQLSSARQSHAAQLAAPSTMTREAFVPLITINGKTPGQSAVDRIRTRVENPQTHKTYDLTCTPQSLRAAAVILQTGSQPVRTAFNAQGITSSDDIRDAVTYLRGCGWIQPGVAGAPARWIDGLGAGNADDLEAWAEQVIASAEASA